MSKLLELINSHLDEPPRRRPLRSSMVDIKVDETYDSVPLSEEIFYTVGVQLGRSIWAKDSADLEFKKSRVRQELAQFVFGEFKPLLVQLGSRVAYYVPDQKEREEILDIIEDITRRMEV